jgi:hypothetical protein
VDHTGRRECRPVAVHELFVELLRIGSAKPGLTEERVLGLVKRLTRDGKLRWKQFGRGNTCRGIFVAPLHAQTSFTYAPGQDARGPYETNLIAADLAKLYAWCR